MDILGIGFPELIAIFIIALMVLGPRRLPEIAAKAGKLIRDLRNMSQGFLAEWQRELAVAARLEELEEVRQELAEVKQELRQTQKNINPKAMAQEAGLDSSIASIQKSIQSTRPSEQTSPQIEPEENENETQNGASSSPASIKSASPVTQSQEAVNE